MAQFYEGSPAVSSEQAPLKVLRQGTATIAVGTKIIAVLDAQISTNSVVVCWGLGAADTTALAFSVDVISANVGFSVGTNANATAAKNVGWAILKY